MKIAVTGLSSFTGSYIANYFAKKEWDVYGQCSKKERDYQPLQLERLNSLNPKINITYELKAENDSIAKWADKIKPDIWVHHYHHMDNWRNDEYDLEFSRKVSIAPLKNLTEALALNQCKGVIFSGTFSEPGEGGPNREGEPNLYAKSKYETWVNIKTLANKVNLKISKVIIPNPFGPRENADRLVPLIINHAAKNKKLVLKNPKYISDNLPITELVKIYLDAANNLLKGIEKIYRPSGWVTTVQELGNAVNKEILSSRLKSRNCEFDLGKANPLQNFLRNSKDEEVDTNWDYFWSEYASWLSSVNYQELWKTNFPEK